VPVVPIRGSGPAAERLRAFVRDRVRKEGAHYQRGAQVRLAKLLHKPPSWVSNYVDLSPSANADLDTALKICAFFAVRPMVLLDDVQIAAPTPTPPLTRHEARAVRLLKRMNEKGQRLAVRSIAGFADAFPKPPSQESARPAREMPSARASTKRGRR